MTAPQAPLNTPSKPPYKTAGLVMLVLPVVVGTLMWFQFRGEFTAREQLTMLSSRAGLSMDPGAKVTYNGVQIGRVAAIDAVNVGGEPKAKILLDVDAKYVDLIPANVVADITASTIFGNKYVSFSSPKNPVAQRITSSDVIDVSGVTTESNSLFETVVSVAEKVDPVKLNQTLTATAQALDGLGDRFGAALVNANDILGDLNPRTSQLRYDIQRFADLGDLLAYLFDENPEEAPDPFDLSAGAAPDLFGGLENARTTVRTLNEQQGDLDRALMAAVGFGNTGGDVLERGGPYLVRGAHDLVPTSALLDEYSPEFFCMIRNYHDLVPIADALSSNGYSLKAKSEIVGAGNPYVYPDNLPRVNAKGGPEGRPGCWQKVTRDLWPAPYLVMDTGASIAPYNHFELGQPLAIDYVWGRQIGENTINP